jgi:hypothetical protein
MLTQKEIENWRQIAKNPPVFTEDRGDYYRESREGLFKLIEAVEKMTDALNRISFAFQHPVERPPSAQYEYIAYNVLNEVWGEDDNTR